MRAKKFAKQNIVFAEKQDEYASLPGFAQENGIATFKFRLSPKEMAEAVHKGKIFIGLVCFDNPMMPMKVYFEEPEFPVHVVGIRSDPDVFLEAKMFRDIPTRIAYRVIRVEGDDLKLLTEHREIWVSVSTFGTSLQPIALSCNEPEEEHIDATKSWDPNKLF